MPALTTATRITASSGAAPDLLYNAGILRDGLWDRLAGLRAGTASMGANGLRWNSPNNCNGMNACSLLPHSSLGACATGESESWPLLDAGPESKDVAAMRETDKGKEGQDPGRSRASHEWGGYHGDRSM